MTTACGIVERCHQLVVIVAIINQVTDLCAGCKEQFHDFRIHAMVVCNSQRQRLIASFVLKQKSDGSDVVELRCSLARFNKRLLSA